MLRRSTGMTPTESLLSSPTLCRSLWRLSMAGDVTLLYVYVKVSMPAVALLSEGQDGRAPLGLCAMMGAVRRSESAKGLLAALAMLVLAMQLVAPSGFMPVRTERGVVVTLCTGQGEIGRASSRERVCQYVYISVVAVSLKNKYENVRTRE